MGGGWRLGGTPAARHHKGIRGVDNRNLQHCTAVQNSTSPKTLKPEVRHTSKAPNASAPRAIQVQERFPDAGGTCGDLFRTSDFRA